MYEILRRIVEQEPNELSPDRSDISKPPIYAQQPQQPVSYPAIPSSYEVQPPQQLTQYPSSYAASVGE
ncbi:MAG: hypothetical protein EZS28_033474 [Streblomastix strix]|uniref:Uncharacterized protein n=1 Tax=Streblomastix strix TaxID=222440 RepID=A0A5J4ULT6_9EUKA|nr:MAG: hypothetical protein EZS28_033474 [Streblomastix strix]